MSAPRALLLVGLIAAATYTASSALTPVRSPVSQMIDDDSLRAGPDSGRVARLLDALGKTDPLVCELVADQLGNFWWDGDRHGLGAFSDATPQSGDVKARRAAKDSLGGRVRDPRAVALLSSNLGAIDPCVRRIAAKMLGRSVVPTAQLVKLLGDPSPRVREAAAFAIGIGERGEARTALEKELDSRDGPVAAMSAWALWEIHDSASVPALMRAMRASNPLVRVGAARGLGEIKDDRALPELERALRSDTDAPVRTSAAEALSELGAESSASWLAVALGDASAEVRYAAAGALGELHDLRKAPEALIRAAGTNDPHLTKLAAQALAEIHDPATVDVLVALLANTDRSVRLKAVEALGEIRSPKATPGLVKALKDSNAEVRKAAAAALGEIKEGS